MTDLKTNRLLWSAALAILSISLTACGGGSETLVVSKNGLDPAGTKSLMAKRGISEIASFCALKDYSRQTEQSTTGIPEPYIFFVIDSVQLVEAEKIGLMAITQADRDRYYTKPFDCSKWNDLLGVPPDVKPIG